MKYLPVIFALLVWGITYHSMYILTDQFWSQPNLYCKTNATPQEYNTCTKFVVVGGFMVFIVPLGLAIGMYTIINFVQKKERELIINEI